MKVSLHSNSHKYYIVSITKKSGAIRKQEYLLGICKYLPIISKLGKDILQFPITIDLETSGVAITGEVMWDQNQI